MIPCFPPVGLGEAPATPQHGSNGLGQPIFWGFGELGNVAAARVVQERIRTNGWVAATCGIAKESLKTIRGIIAGSGVTRQRTTPQRVLTRDVRWDDLQLRREWSPSQMGNY